ncbi:MAG: lambda exonuclease family protein [Candidatus Magnetobacterium sp. LHC-1]
MIVDNIKQGSIEWQGYRVGIPTASNFDKIITTEGKPSKQRQKYMFTLAAERITGIKEETYQNGAMQRGIQLEEEARRMYELISGYSVDQVGICYQNEKKLYGCSPDGLVGNDGCLEIKCPTSAVHVSYLLEGVIPTEYIQQTQGQLLVTGRKWVDFVSYSPGLRPLIVRAIPDTKFISLLREGLEKFCLELDEVTKKLRG